LIYYTIVIAVTVLIKYHNKMQSAGQLDKLMKDARLDLLTEQELWILFEQLDMVERYADMLSLLMKYTGSITKHFEATSAVFRYNLQHKWNWDLKTLGNLSEKEWHTDLLLLAKRTYDYKISKLITDRLANK
jgi:hypothetical protein